MSALHVRVFASEDGDPNLTLRRSRPQHRSPQGSCGAFLNALAMQKTTGEKSEQLWVTLRRAFAMRVCGLLCPLPENLPWVEDLTCRFWLVTEPNRLGAVKNNPNSDIFRKECFDF